jgi:hypothetical protein
MAILVRDKLDKETYTVEIVDRNDSNIAKLEKTIADRNVLERLIYYCRERGCDIKIFDENIKCNIKPFTRTGDMFLLIGKGYPNGRYKTNLIIEIKVKDLLELNEEQLDLVRKIKEIGER